MPNSIGGGYKPAPYGLGNPLGVEIATGWFGFAQRCVLSGGPTRIRTWNQGIMSPLL